MAKLVTNFITDFVTNIKIFSLQRHITPPSLVTYINLRSEYVCPCGRWWYSFFEGFNPPDQRCHDCRQMVNSVESETKNRYELMARILPDDDDVSTATTRVVPIEESRRIDQIMKGSDAGILGGVQNCLH